MIRETEALFRFLKKAGLMTAEPHRSVFSASLDGPILALSKTGMLSESSVIEAISKEFGIPYWDLSKPDALTDISPDSFRSHIDANICWSKKIIPLKQEAESVVVAFANPLDHDAFKLVQFELENKIRPVIAREKDILRLLRMNFPKTEHQFLNLHETKDGYIEIVSKLSDEHLLDHAAPDTPPAIKLVNKIITDALMAKASDVHLEPTQDCLVIRFRIDGILHYIVDLPKRLQPYVISRCKLLAGMDISERRRLQDGRFRVRSLGNVVDIRASAVPISYGEKIVLRLLSADTSEWTLKSLGMPAEMVERVISGLGQRDKILFVTGPTGSGKTTTLYSCINYVNDGTSNIETIEDPVEYRVSGVSQIQVNPSVDISFSSALRAILRQDPDIILVGEVRDEDTANIALQAAQTGHLVLSSMHTNDAPSAITRLANLGCPGYLIASSVGAVLAQRLVRRICEHCREAVSADYCERYKDLVDQKNMDIGLLGAGKGCENCHQTGYLGRMGIFSYLEISDAIRALIDGDARQSQIVGAAKNEGFTPLKAAALNAVCSGHTTFDEVRPYL